LLPGIAAAQDCLDQVDEFAAKQGVATELPHAGNEDTAPAEPTDQSLSDKLSQSGGVLEPPKTESKTPTLQPPPGQNAPMPTAPEIEPEPGSGGGSLTEQSGEDAQIESLLTAARQAAQSGDDQQCFKRLQEAKAIAANKPEG
jgi:hypothetical protein